MHDKDILIRTDELPWQPIGAHHEKTHALEETVIFFVGHGPLAMLDADGRICGAIGSDGVTAFGMAHA